ncbi:unnamed protein product [Hymenolepis diminuta]|uniref:UBA domain-containing protein n=1 Tax=Hymenolepis diminuta TaxID=6216 RepID=A0A564YF28_HYMDI|nr:unnamed protein product [Hymenolepis diminuta]
MLRFFDKSEVTKCFFVSTAALSAFVQFSSSVTRSHFRYDVSSILNEHELSRLFLSKTAFVEPSDFFFGCIIIYQYRLFERRFGSRKYLSSVIWLFTLSTALELLSTGILSKYGITLSILPSGPFFLIYPFFVYYFFDIPNVSVMNSFASPLSRKLFLYFLGLKLATSTIGSLVVSGCGLLAGLLYRYTFIQRINLIPSPVARVLSRILSPIFASGESKDDQTPIGATLEIQRQEALDRQEQMLMDLKRSQVMNLIRSRNSDPNLVSRPTVSYRRRSYVPEPQDVRRLTEMGFSEEQVNQALIATHGDLNDAISLLKSPTFFQQ